MNRGFGPVLAALFACLVAAGSGLGGCDGGTSSETVGFVEAIPGSVGISGRTDAGNSVSLYSADFQPHLDRGFAESVTAGPDGGFSFGNLVPGKYQLLARRPSDGKSALIMDLAVPPGPEGPRRAALEPTGTLSGRITGDSATSLGLVYVPGTPFFASGDGLMRYSLEGLPPGTYRVVKSWKRIVPCDPGIVCGGVESREDSAVVGIRSGVDVIW